MVHKTARKWGIEKFEPIKLIGFDYVDKEWQNIEVFPDSKVVVIEPAHYGEDKEIRSFDRIRDGV